MVHILVNVGFDRTVRNLMETCDNQLDDTLTVLDYPDILTRRHVPAGTYVFTDFERCTKSDLAAVKALWDQLAATGHARLVNHPRSVMWRFPLLRMLAARGLNDFNVYRPGDNLAALRFPVFLRCEHDHGGVRTDLLHSHEALRRGIAHMRRNLAWRNQILITEFGAAKDADGLYRKYGALLVEGHILPCQLMASEGWFVKGRTRLVRPEIVAEEHRYVEENPHADVLRERFKLANIEYGRIDYGIVEGRVQVYEINTNPTIVGGRGKASSRRAKRLLLTGKLVAAFREMDAKAPASTGVATRITLTPRRRALPSWAYRGIRKMQSLVTRVTHRSGIR
jgi:hypothetical protein